MAFEAVIFDLDGTLLNTLDDLADSLNRVLLARDIGSYPSEAYRYFVGNGAVELVSRALPPDQRDPALIAECLAEFRNEYQLNWNVKTRPYDGVPELLDALSARGIRMAVLTNKPQDSAELCIREFFPNRNFAAVFGQRDGVPMKPNPAGACELARIMSLSSRKCIYLGDSDIDMVTAVRAGMLPVGALWGFRTEKELLANGAAKTISRPMELLELIDSENQSGTFSASNRGGRRNP